MKVHLFEHSEPIEVWGMEERQALCGKIVPQAERCFMANKLILPFDITDGEFYRQVCMSCLAKEGLDPFKHYLSAIVSKEDAIYLERKSREQDLALTG